MFPQVPVTTLQVVPDTWLQVVLVTHPDSNNVTLYDHKENQLDLVLPSILTSITVDMNAVVLRRKGALFSIAMLSPVPVSRSEMTLCSWQDVKIQLLTAIKLFLYTFYTQIVFVCIFFFFPWKWLMWNHHLLYNLN